MHIVLGRNIPCMLNNICGLTIAEPKAKNKLIKYIQAPSLLTPGGIAYCCPFQGLGQDVVNSLFIVNPIVRRGFVFGHSVLECNT